MFRFYCLRVQGLGFWIEVLGFRVEGLGGAESRDGDLGLRVLHLLNGGISSSDFLELCANFNVAPPTLNPKNLKRILKEVQH